MKKGSGQMTNLYKLAASLSVSLLVFIWVARFPALVGVEPGPVGILIELAIAVISAVATWILVGKRVSSRPERAEPLGLSWISVIVAPILGTALLVTAWFRSGGYPMWAIEGDMATNTMQSLAIHEAGGVGFGANPNPAPLTNLLFALGYGLDQTPSLFQAIFSNALVLLLVGATASLLSGWFTLGFTRQLNPLMSAALVFGVGWIPYTGILLHQIFAAGHANVWIAYLVLWLAVIVHASPHWLIGLQGKIAILFGLVTVAASAWAPLMTVPFALVISLLATTWGQRKTEDVRRPGGWLLPLLSFVQMAIYMVAFSLADLRGHGQALAANGWTAPYTTRTVAISFVLYAALSVWFWVAAGRRGWSQARLVNQGQLWMLASSIAGFGLLVIPRLGQESLLGYYPVKYLTLVLTLTASVLIGQVAVLISSGTGLVKQLAAGVLALAVFLFATLSPFNYQTKKMAVASAVTILGTDYSETHLQSVDRLVTIFDADPYGANVVLSDDPFEYGLPNFYLIRLSVAEGLPNPASIYIYTPQPWTNEQLCDLVTVWDIPVTVHTAPEEVAATQARVAGCEGDPNVEVVAWPEP
ncbi:MAG: hypothetical protein WAS54_08735 [Scrofimicrobium sp.]